MSGTALHPVDSSMMSHVGYDPTSRTLSILFQSGKLYEYLDVEQQIFDGLLAAASKGSYFNGWIADSYECRLVTGRRRR